MMKKLSKINLFTFIIFLAVYFLIVMYSKNIILNSIIISVLTFVFSLFTCRTRLISDGETSDLKSCLKACLKELPLIILATAILITIMLSKNKMISDKTFLWLNTAMVLMLSSRDKSPNKKKTAEYYFNKTLSLLFTTTLAIALVLCLTNVISSGTCIVIVIVSLIIFCVSTWFYCWVQKKNKNKTAQYGELRSPQSHHEESE